MKFCVCKFVFLLHTETKQELVETREDLVKTVDDLSAKLNGNCLLYYKFNKIQNILNLNFIKSCNWIAATTELLTKTVNNLVKTNTELRNVQSELSNTRIDMTDKFKGNISD